MKPVRAYLALLLPALVCAGASAQETPPSRDAVRPPDRVRTTESQDALGVVFHPSSAPQRIVSLSPNLTEILFAVGVKRERIVGITRFCDFPSETDGIARVGGIVDPSIESILTLRPDLVVATRGNPMAILDRLHSAGVATFAFDSQTGIAGIYETMRVMVRIVSPDDTMRAGAALHAFSNALACAKEASAGIVQGERSRVYYYDPASPDWTAGPGTHVSEAISLAGGTNIGDDASVAWPRLSPEVILVRQPEVILVAAQGADTGEVAKQAILARLRERPAWRGLPAVREGRLCMTPADWLLRPGPRIIRAIQMLGRCLHPDRDWGCPG